MSMYTSRPPMHVLMSEPQQKTQHHADAQECHGSPLRKPLFSLLIAPLHARSGMKKNVSHRLVASPRWGVDHEGSSSQKLRSARPEWTVPPVGRHATKR